MRFRKMFDAQMPETFCPHCFTRLDTNSNPEDSTAPGPGDFTLCIVCANLLRFDENLQICAASFDELPVYERAKFAYVKRTIEAARLEWNAIHSTPWGGRR